MNFLLFQTILLAIGLTSSQLQGLPRQNDASQQVLQQESIFPGFHVDLGERRLLQLESGEQVWVSEMDKLERKMRGEKFFDMCDFFCPNFPLNMST
jgi:hypothetical protein